MKNFSLSKSNIAELNKLEAERISRKEQCLYNLQNCSNIIYNAEELIIQNEQLLIVEDSLELIDNVDKLEKMLKREQRKALRILTDMTSTLTVERKLKAQAVNNIVEIILELGYDNN